MATATAAIFRKRRDTEYRAIAFAIASLLLHRAQHLATPSARSAEIPRETRLRPNFISVRVAAA
jgi:hypothetical protein